VASAQSKLSSVVIKYNITKGEAELTDRQLYGFLKLTSSEVYLLDEWWVPICALRIGSEMHNNFVQQSDLVC
jgi:hypothetical protein